MDLFLSSTEVGSADCAGDARLTEVESFPTSSLKHHITRLVVTRAAAVRATNPALAAEYRKLATLGAVDAAVYSRVLRSASGAVRVSRLGDPRESEPEAA